MVLPKFSTKKRNGFLPTRILYHSCSWLLGLFSFRYGTGGGTPWQEKFLCENQSKKTYRELSELLLPIFSLQMKNDLQPTNAAAS